MAPPKVMTGARGIVRINGIPVGHFDSINWGVTLDVAPISVLGRFTPAETVYTGQEPVRVTATGWRVINSVGLQGQVQFPTVQQLLLHEYMQIDVVDRQGAALNLGANGPRIAIIRDVRPDTYSTGIVARQASQVSYSFIALLCDDEATANAESPAPVGDLPPVQ